MGTPLLSAAFVRTLHPSGHAYYSIGEISKASNFEAFQRCTLKEIPEQILKAARKAGDVDEIKKAGKASAEGLKKVGGMLGRLKK